RPTRRPPARVRCNDGLGGGAPTKQLALRPWSYRMTPGGTARLPCNSFRRSRPKCVSRGQKRFSDGINGVLELGNQRVGSPPELGCGTPERQVDSQAVCKEAAWIHIARHEQILLETVKCQRKQVPQANPLADHDAKILDGEFL